MCMCVHHPVFTCSTHAEPHSVENTMLVHVHSVLQYVTSVCLSSLFIRGFVTSTNEIIPNANLADAVVTGVGVVVSSSFHVRAFAFCKCSR